MTKCPFSKQHKTIFPFRTHLNAFSAVVFVKLVAFIVATAFHAVPNFIQSRIASSMFFFPRTHKTLHGLFGDRIRMPLQYCHNRIYISTLDYSRFFHMILLLISRIVSPSNLLSLFPPCVLVTSGAGIGFSYRTFASSALHSSSR